MNETKNRSKNKEGLYSFRNKEFMSDEWTIRQLNLALAMNYKNERYIKVQNGKHQ